MDTAIDELNEDELEVLVRSAVVEAVEQRQEPPYGGVTDLVVFGAGAKPAIKRAVMLAVRDLISKKVLLSGPLKDAADKVTSFSSQAEALWETLKTIQATLEEEVGSCDQIPESSEPGPTDEPEAQEPEAQEPEAQEPALQPPPPPPPQPQSPPPQPQPPPPPPPEKKHKRPTKNVAPPAHDDIELEETDIVVNGIRVAFYPKTPQSFRSFLREFAQEISRSPVRPSWALRRAHEHGWKVLRGTVLAQIENYVGDLSKWKDDNGDAWWSLPSNDGTPSGRPRK